MSNTTDLRIETALGAVEFNWTDAEHVYVDNPHQEWLTVRGVQIHLGGAHLYRWQDGRFHLGEEAKEPYQQRQSLHLSRQDAYTDRNRTGKEPSESARKLIAQVIEGAVNDWSRDHQDIIRAAEIQYRQSELNKAEENLRQLRLSLIAETAARDACAAALDRAQS